MLAASKADLLRVSSFFISPWVLRGDAGDGAGAVRAEGGEGFEIGLYTRTAPAVRAGDGQGDGKWRAFRHAASIVALGALSASR